MKRLPYLILGLMLFLFSCQTYYIPVDSFKKQFARMQESKMKEVTVKEPTGIRTKYKTFPIDYVDCVDKKGNSIRLEKSPSLEIRFTDDNNKKTTFYFDKIFVTDTTVTGTQSRLLSIVRTISLMDIKKIEIQDGRKRYKYVN